MPIFFAFLLSSCATVIQLDKRCIMIQRGLLLAGPVGTGAARVRLVWSDLQERQQQTSLPLFYKIHKHMLLYLRIGTYLRSVKGAGKPKISKVA